jgi:hypothetical protein
MIAEIVNAAIAGIGFCHAAGRLIFYREAKAATRSSQKTALSR